MRQETTQKTVKGRGSPALLTITATKWHEPILVSDEEKEWRLRNWFGIDFTNGRDKIEDFTWGYQGAGPHATAYAILREIYGKKTALEYYSAFVDVYVSKLSEDRGFRLTSAELEDMVPEMVMQKYGQQ